MQFICNEYTLIDSLAYNNADIYKQSASCFQNNIFKFKYLKRSMYNYSSTMQIFPWH